MDGAFSESTDKGTKTAKVLFVLSLILPYLAYWMSEEEFRQFVLYAPIWVAAISEWSTFIGPTPTALFMIVYWFPYVFVGYQSYRFAQGKYSTVGRYVAGVAFVTLIGVTFGLSLMGASTASSGGVAYYPTMVPLPLVSILALLLIPLLRPAVVASSWDTSKQDVFAQEDIVNLVQDLESQK